nr:methyltransferase [Streptomyces alkaliphilus]
MRDALLAADFTPDGLLERLGAPAYAALARGETVPALRATRDGDAAAVLARLFLLRAPVPAKRAAEVLPLDAALEAGWLRRAPGGTTPDGGDGREGDGDPAQAVRAAVDIRPWAGPGGEDWFIASDAGHALGGRAGVAAGSPRPDVVLGVGGASTTLTHLIPDTPVGRALDVGTGCGVQALHLTRHAAAVTATDPNPRALRMAELTLELSAAPAAEYREGSLYEPVADDEPFDLIVSNPPFVISPPEPGSPRLVYRDGNMAGDELCRSLVRGAADRLAPGGTLIMLANWEHTVDGDWRERFAAWLPPGCDARVVQREEQDITEYAELWLRDAGDHRDDPARYAARYDAWLENFEARGVRGVGLGWIMLRRADTDRPSVLLEEWPHAVRQPLGPTVAEYFDLCGVLRRDDERLLAARYRLADEVVQEQIGLPGAEHPEHVVLRQHSGMMRALTVDTIGAGFAGACDGTLTAGAIGDAIARLLGDDPAELRSRLPELLRGLLEQGFLRPAD